MNNKIKNNYSKNTTIISLLILLGALTYVIFEPKTIIDVIKFSFITVFILIGTYLFSLYVHEFGHMLMEIICGFSISEVKIGPIIIKTRDKKVRISKSSVLTGYVQRNPKNDNNLRIKLLIIYLAGSLFNIILAILCLFFINRINFTYIMDIILKFTFIFNILFIFELMPNQGTCPFYCDGFWIYHLIKKSYYIDLIILPFEVSLGKKVENISFSTHNTTSNKEIDLFLLWYKYYQFLSKRDFKNINKILLEINHSTNMQNEKNKKIFQHILKMEKLYLFSIMKDEKAADILMKELKESKESPIFNTPRALAQYELLKKKDKQSVKERYNINLDKHLDIIENNGDITKKTRISITMPLIPLVSIFEKKIEKQLFE